MKKFKDSLKSKPTLFSVFGILFLIIGIPFGLYGLTLNGGASLGGTLVLVAIFAFIPFLILDRILVKRIKPLKLSVFELLFTILLLLYYSYNNKKIIVDLTKSNRDYVFVLYNDGQFEDSNLSWTFPFNKKVEIKKNTVILPAEYKGNYRIDIETPFSWNGYRMNPDRINNISLRIYRDIKSELNQSEIDSLAKREINSIIKNSKF